MLSRFVKSQLKYLTALLIVTVLTACGKEEQYVQPPIQQAPVQVAQPQQVPAQVQQPIVVQQAPQNNHDMLIGGMLGYMLGGAGRSGGGGGGGNTTTTTVNKTIVNKTYVQQAPRVPSSPRYSGGGFSRRR